MEDEVVKLLGLQIANLVIQNAQLQVQLMELTQEGENMKEEKKDDPAV